MHDKYYYNFGPLPKKASILSFISTNQFFEKKTSEFDEIFAFLKQNYSSHCFNILGLGWLNYSNTKSKQRIFPFKKDKVLLEIFKKIDADYKIINWHIDYRSNKQWNPNSWYLNWQKEVRLGNDIKNPWELSRLQHLPQLAIISLSYEKDKEIIREIKNQILDFIVSNPPRKGCNWGNAMEVGIRSVNLLITIDILKSQDKYGILDDFFIKVLYKYLISSVYFILGNLELTGNHYLANLTGLITLTFYLPDFRFSEKIQRFAVNEFIEQFDKQFNNDGGNYESSSGYHRFSLEMSLFSFAIIYRLLKRRKKLLTKKNEKILTKVWEKLYNALIFQVSLIKPNGNMVLFGDFDSGRLLNVLYKGDFISKREYNKKYRLINNQDLTRNVNCLKNENDGFWDENHLMSVDYELISNLFFTNERIINSNDFFYNILLSFISYLPPIKVKKKSFKLFKRQTTTNLLDTFPYYRKKIFNVNLCDITENNYFVFLETGIFVLKSQNFYLLFNCTNNGQNGNGGHSHNDKLSYELVINNKEVYVDPGVYSYNLSKSIRNAYRGDFAHNIIHTDISQNDFINQFKNSNSSKCKLIYVTKNTIIGELKYKGVVQYRKINIEPKKIIVEDFSSHKIIKPTANIYLTNGYGKMLNIEVKIY